MEFHINSAEIKAYFEDAELEPRRKLSTFIPKEQYEAHHLSVVLHGFLASDPIIDGPIIVWPVDQLVILY